MSGSELATRADGMPAAHERQFSGEQLDLIRRTIAQGATPDELALFLYQARRTGLDPLARQIHFVKRGGTGAIQVGIDGYRLIADRTGKYAGNDDPVFAGSGAQPEAATVTVWKLIDGQRCPFTATARWSEYFPGDTQGFMWKRMPFLMLGKTAEALALRKAFPAELSGLYTDTEMDQAGPPDGRPAAAAPPARRQEPAQHFDAQPVDDAPDDEDAFAGFDAGPEAPRPTLAPTRSDGPSASPKQIETIRRMARAAGEDIDTDGLSRTEASDIITRLIGQMGQRRGG